jgi:Tol biopolymer transport system component
VVRITLFIFLSLRPPAPPRTVADVPTTEQLNNALAGRYVIDRHIGEGGMATVYLARDIRHQRKVALKVLKPDLGAVVGVERFLSEIQVTANLQHPNLLPLFDSGASDGLLFYVMPYVEGESLRARIQREKQLSVDDAVRLTTAIASALDYAHRHGVIHRDLKPENILLHEDQPLVADFGIALALSNAGGNRITQTGLSLGTPQYMSPEQATGDRVIDARTDIYSLGAVVYEMLTGEPPHTGPTSHAIIARVLTDTPRSIRSSRPAVPEHVEFAVERALEKLPADRWATAKEFSEAITGARVVTRSTLGATHAGSRRREAGRARRREIVAWSVAAVALAAAGIASWRANRRAPAPLPLEFEVKVPDSLDLLPRGGAASLALSPDGSTLVFQGQRLGEPAALYVRRLGDRDVLKIRGTDSARSPVLSPDGDEVLFGNIVPAGPGLATSPVRRISIRGGSARTVVDSGAANGQVAWGQDDRLVLAINNRVWTVSADGGPRTLLTTRDSARRHVRYGFPDILPGGKAALITIWKGATTLDSAVLGIVTIPDGKVTELGVRGTFPRYSGTGHIVYATIDAWIFALPFDARSLRVRGPGFPIVEGVRVGGGGAAAFSVARNGALAFIGGSSFLGDRALVAVSRAGKERLLGARTGFYGTPRVSPDGRQIVATMATQLAMFGNAGSPDIWRFDIASKVMTRVTTDSSSGRPEWSRDGQSILYIKRGTDTVVMSRPLYAAAQPTVLFRLSRPIGDFTLGGAHGYAALRTGAAGANSGDVWLVHMDSVDKPHAFLNEPYSEFEPRISPDGQRIAYVTNRTGRDEVYVRPIGGGGSEAQVSVDGGTEPVWSPDGRELFYRGPDYMMSATLAGAPSLVVTRRDLLFRAAGTYMRGPAATNYDVFPGGQEFLMLRPTETAVTSSPLIVKMNWHVRPGSRTDSRDR